MAGWHIWSSVLLCSQNDIYVKKMLCFRRIGTEMVKYLYQGIHYKSYKGACAQSTTWVKMAGDILFFTRHWGWFSLFPVCSYGCWICNSHSHLHGCSNCARSVKFWNKRWKVWSSGWEVWSSVDDRFWSETIQCPSSLEFFHFSYRETVTDLWWNWCNSSGTLGKGDFVSLFEAQVFHIIVCSEQQEVTDCSREMVVARYFIMWLI